jgi:phosphoglycolate phosphatase-like HAD superfamily hydrolase
MGSQRLLLFDIDGTILTTVRKAFDFPFSEAIREVLSVEADAAHYRAGGKTDPQIIHELLATSGLMPGEVDDAIPAIKNRYLEKLKSRLTKPEDALLKPGVLHLLEMLSKRKDAVLALLTGNFEDGARLKLSVHDLNRYFPFGAFGDGARDRNPLPKRAVNAAKEITGVSFVGKDIVIIGDTPHDVRCGSPLGVRTVAVATGPYSMDQLKNEKPDFLFETLADTDQVMEALFKPM